LPCDFSLQTKVGILPLKIDVDAAGETLVFMSQAPSKFKAFDGDRVLLARSLGIATADLHPSLPIMYGSTGCWTMVVPVRGLDAMWRMHPLPAQFAGVVSAVPGASIYPFCTESLGTDVDVHARHFCSPGFGRVEDPVTVTAAGVLGAYYREFVEPYRDTSRALLIEQGYEMGREGHVRVWTTGNCNSGYAVRIAGTACFVEERSYRQGEVDQEAEATVS
jgi:PhzF family phenazine biosynthesis protein